MGRAVRGCDLRVSKEAAHKIYTVRICPCCASASDESDSSRSGTKHPRTVARERSIG
jgi:hypothetical protein